MRGKRGVCMDKARRAAAVAIMQMHGGRYASEALHVALKKEKLSQRESAFASSLFFHTAEHLITLDVLLLPFLRRSLDKLDVEVRAVLETGLCQMRYMQVPNHAAIHEAVALTRGFGKSSAAGFVNAVLRKASTATAIDDADMTKIENVCAKYSVSSAVAEALMDALPQEYEAYLQACYSQGALSIRVNTLRIEEKELKEKFLRQKTHVESGMHQNSLRIQLSGGVANDEFFAQGFYHVQDFASQYAALCLQAKKGMRVLDLCAAPGGKSATLAQEMQGGEGLTVCDVNETRLQRAKSLFSSLGIEGAHFLQNDASVYNKELEAQDAVLCDVPCSGLGVLATKPDLRYTSGDHFSNLPALQLSILQTAARYVRVGGRLVYSTCTPLCVENEQVVQAFLQKGDCFKLFLPKDVPKNVCIRNDMLYFLPQNTNTSGFFIACMERIC